MYNKELINVEKQENGKQSQEKQSTKTYPKMMVYIRIDKLRAALINMTKDKEKKDTCSSGNEKVYYPK